MGRTVRKPLRSAERGTSRQVSLRIPAYIVSELEEYVARTGLSMSAAMTQGMKEWLRMQRHPGIDFRWTPAGREAHVTGTGLAVWELHHVWQDHGQNIEKIHANYPRLSDAQILGALRYARAYPDEVPAGWGEPPKWIQNVQA